MSRNTWQSWKQSRNRLLLLALGEALRGDCHIQSKLRSPGEVMTKPMLAAIEDPNINIVGHCTGRIVVGRGRPSPTTRQW